MDEAQLEVSSGLVDFKMVRIPEEVKLLTGDELKDKMKELEDEANALREHLIKTTGKEWAEVGHSDKAFYTAYSRPGELATKAVKESGEYYGLNVDLTAGYIIGRSWQETH
mgnify:CR=1 FL=1